MGMLPLSGPRERREGQQAADLERSVESHEAVALVLPKAEQDRELRRRHPGEGAERRASSDTDDRKFARTNPNSRQAPILGPWQIMT